MAKKIILGCAIVLVLGAVAGGFVLYQFVYKPGRELVRAGGEAVKSVTRLEEIARLDDEVADRSPYAAPADGLLAAGQVERFVAVQREVRERLGPRWGVLEAKYEAREGPGREPGLGDLMTFWRDLGDLVLEAKQTQVEAINRAGFSLAEYRWVREQVYLALGLEVFTLGVDEVLTMAREGGMEGVEEMERQRDALRERAPAQNVDLVEPHREELQEWAPLALLGL
jgi:hypothetical protein